MNNKIGKSFSPYTLRSKDDLKNAMQIAKQLQQKSRKELIKNQNVEQTQQKQKTIKKINTSNQKQITDDQIKSMLKIAQRQNKSLKNKVNQNSTIEQIVNTIDKENQQHDKDMLNDLFPDF